MKIADSLYENNLTLFSFVIEITYT